MREELPDPGLPSSRARVQAMASAPSHASAMVERFGLLARLVARWVFARVQVRREDVERLRQLARQGTIVYVMRYRSVVDYLMVNAVLLREGLPLARFATEVSTAWLRPLPDMLRIAWRRLRRLHLFAREVRRYEEHELCARLVQQGYPVVVFMRSLGASRGRKALRAARLGPEYLREVVHALWGAPRPVFLVPVAIFRGKGMRRRESRLATMLYSVQEAPSEAKRLVTTFWNAGEVQLRMGHEIPLARFMEEYGREGEERVVRRLARALQIFLYREERVVWGPALQPRRVVREQVLGDPELRALVARLAAERGVPEQKVWREARGYFREMAANFNGLYFSILEFLFNRIWPRIFSGLELVGLEKVIECVKQHPVVLVPCHRSHFDYLIISYIFHTNFLSPPHIAAGINLSFWPLGPLFRGAGAFFIRRSFDDNELYKMVFRKYLTFLIREGYTQEFFIEGGRTRTGKILTPRLGMLGVLVNAFLRGVRRDLYLVPISIHYGRVIEEEAYKRELAGEEKERESLRGLLRARSVLRKRYGTVYVTFADPISLEAALGPLREKLRSVRNDRLAEEERRRAVRRLGFELLRQVNAVAVAGATSVSATVLLSAPRAACRLGDFLHSARLLVELLRFQGVRFTASLERNVRSDFRESLAWLEGGGLIERVADAAGEVIYVPTSKRANLDFYKNNTIHFFLLPSLLARVIQARGPVPRLEEEVRWWLDLYRWEFPLPEREALGSEIARWLGYFRDAGALVGGEVVGSHPLLPLLASILENFREAYLTAVRTVCAEKDWPLGQRQLIQRARRHFATSLLLGEVTKPEAASAVTFANALSRLAELGCLETLAEGRERRFVPGPRFAELAALAQRLEG